jgi:hypothetical protein
VGIWKLKRLDRFYCFSNLHRDPATHVLQYEILGDCLVSDHLSVTLSIEIQPDSSQGSHYKLNSSYLKDHRVFQQLHTIWRQFLATLNFFDKFQRLMKWFKMFCHDKAQERKATEISLWHQLSQTHMWLQQDTSDD